MAVSGRKAGGTKLGLQFRRILTLTVFLPVAQASEILKTIHVDHAFRYDGGEWEIVIHGLSLIHI